MEKIEMKGAFIIFVMMSASIAWHGDTASLLLCIIHAFLFLVSFILWCMA